MQSRCDIALAAFAAFPHGRAAWPRFPLSAPAHCHEFGDGRLAALVKPHAPAVRIGPYPLVSKLYCRFHRIAAGYLWPHKILACFAVHDARGQAGVATAVEVRPSEPFAFHQFGTLIVMVSPYSIIQQSNHESNNSFDIGFALIYDCFSGGVLARRETAGRLPAGDRPTRGHVL